MSQPFHVGWANQDEGVLAMKTDDYLREGHRFAHNLNGDHFSISTAIERAAHR